MALRVWITRHGDRTDYEMGIPAWHAIANPNRVKDPPLSALGRQQAIEMGKEAAKNTGKIDRIITSPFLRCLETARPLSLALKLPLLVDYSLFEVGIGGEYTLPTLEERQCYFPFIDMQYESVFKPESGEKYPEGAQMRFGKATQALIDKFPGESIFLCTHAAGVTSIVSFLLKISVPEIEGTWPACLFCLERDTVDSPWKLHAKYNGTHDHLSDVSGNTTPWPRPDADQVESVKIFTDSMNTMPWIKK